MAVNSQSAIVRSLWAVGLAFTAALAASGEVYDGVAASIGNHAIKSSDVNRDIRLTAFLNGGKLDFSVEAKRKSVERLIDQWLIRNEMLKRNFDPSPQNPEPVFEKIKAVKFHGTAEYEQALAAYGITETELKNHIAWQATVLRFIAVRFQAQPFLPWLDESRRRAAVQFRGGLAP